MPNKEGFEELDAQLVVEVLAKSDLDHADDFGGVDYLSPDGAEALEVTTFTNPKAKAAQKFIPGLLNSETPAPHLKACWLVTVSELHGAMKGIEGRVVTALKRLEDNSVAELWDFKAGYLAMSTAALREPVRNLINDGVQHAVQAPELCAKHGAGVGHIVLWSTAGGGTSPGSDSALAAIESDLNARPDNFKKLADSGATTTHLFVWLDEGTDFAVAFPFQSSHDAPYEHFGLPSRPPALSGAVDQLWIAHRTFRHGWHWNGMKWNDFVAPLPRT